MMIIQQPEPIPKGKCYLCRRFQATQNPPPLHLHFQPPMAATAATNNLSYTYFIVGSPSFTPKFAGLTFSRHIHNSLFTTTNVATRHRREVRFQPRTVVCSASDDPTPTPEISSSAKIRGEVLAPFRSVRMFFYLAFIASASLGGLIATSQLIGALANSSRADQVPEIAKGLAIDLGAVAVFAFLYYRDNTAKNAQLARLSREENLSALKIRVDQKRTLPVSAFRGIARLVILSGPESYIAEAFKSSEPFTEGLVERAVLVVPFVTDGSLPSFEFDDSEEKKELTAKRRRLWQLAPVFTNEWSSWLDDQKKLAGVSGDSPVYLSLRMDGRVRGSGVGYPPWNAFVAQLPPLKGMWSGVLDGMDGRV